MEPSGSQLEPKLVLIESETVQLLKSVPQQPEQEETVQILQCPVQSVQDTSIHMASALRIKPL